MVPEGRGAGCTDLLQRIYEKRWWSGVGCVGLGLEFRLGLMGVGLSANEKEVCMTRPS
jgi:hypothetical protein